MSAPRSPADADIAVAGRQVHAADAAFREAVAHHEAGRLREAEAGYRQALALCPAHADSLHLLGVIAIQAGRPDAAEGLIRQAIAIAPAPAMKSNLGMLLHASGRYLEAIDLCREAIAEDPKLADAHANLGNALQGAGRLDEAVSAYRTALALRPEFAIAENALGTVLCKLGDDAAAREAFLRAASANPPLADAHANLGDLCLRLGELDAAERHYRAALGIDAGRTAVRASLGKVLRKIGKVDEAIDCFRAVVGQEPQSFDAHAFLGKVLLATGKVKEAAHHCRIALSLQPDAAEAYLDLGNVLQELGRFDEAIAQYEHALALDPGFVEALNNLGSTLQLQGRNEEAVAWYRRALALNPEHAEIHSNLLFALSYLPDPRDYARESRAFGEAVTQRATPFSQWNVDRAAGRGQALRIGFVSGDLFNHPVGFFLESMLAHLAPHQASLYAYSSNRSEDALTSRLKPHFAVWHCVEGWSDRRLAETIHADGIHVLIDLSGHTARNRLPVFAWHPAPVQASWLGYWASTGVPAIRHVIADRVSLPPEHAWQYVEQPAYLPSTRMCFSAPAMDIDAGDFPQAEGGRITFCCFQSMFKITDEMLGLWSRILRALPGARLHLQNRQLIAQDLRDAVLSRLERAGIAPAQVDLAGPSTREKYLASYARMHIALDTFPYTGGTTTCEAMWMGVPTVTLAGQTMISRQGASLLSAAGLSDWVAASAEEYVDIAVRNARNIAGLRDLRRRLRARALASPLFDAAGFASAFIDTVRALSLRHDADAVRDGMET